MSDYQYNGQIWIFKTSLIMSDQVRDHWKTPVHLAGLQDAMQVYTGLSPKKHHKKPNLWDSQMKTVFSSYSVVAVMTAILAP
jgi:hypothetical protein